MEGQCTKQVNFIPDVVKGLTRRTSTRDIGILGTAISHNVKHHSYDRGNEAYYMQVAPSTQTVKVFDLQGRQMVVNGTAPYISTPNPASSLDMHTVGDFTFITNKTVGVTMSSELSTAASHVGVAYCQFATYGRTYTIRGDGAILASYTTPDGGEASHSDAVQTDYVMLRLYTEIVGGLVRGAGGVDATTFPGVPGWTAEYHDNVIYLQKSSGDDYTLSTTDSSSGNDLKAIKGAVKSVADLPPLAPNNFVVRITGEGKSKKDDYWVIATNTTESKVTWRETVEPNIPISFNAGTMPHVLIRESVDGSGIATFTLQPADWDKREVGGLDSNPVPAFIDPANPIRIQAVGTFQNRLFFLANESWVASRSGLFFNFWRESGQTAIDTDPLDGYADTDQVNNLYSYQILNGDLVLFSDRAQFVIKGDKPVVKATLTLIQITSYPNNINVTPQAAGENIFFAFDAAGFTGIRELFTDNYSDTKKAFPITDYVSKYVLGSASQILSSPNYNSLLIRTPSARSTVWVYNWVWQADQKVQSAWHDWQFSGDVEHLFFIDDKLYLVSNHVGQCRMHSMFMVNDPDDVGLPFSVRLDYKSAAVAAYDPNNNWWSFTLPNPSENIKIVQITGHAYMIGMDLEYTRSGNTFIIKDELSDKTNVQVVVGTPYKSEYIPTNPVVKDQRDRVIGLDKIILQGIYIHYESTGYLKASVQPKGWSVMTYEFFGRYMGSLANTIGSMQMEDGTYRVPVRGRADNLVFNISSESVYPLTIRDMECNGTFHQRGQRI